MPKIEKTLNLEIVSPNRKEHWSSTYIRNKKNHKKIKYEIFSSNEKITTPCQIVLKRTGVRIYDKDNYIFSCKGIKDSIASLILNKKKGQDDDNPGIEWIYEQVKGKPEFTIKITWEAH
jgi:hypothetical protein